MSQDGKLFSAFGNQYMTLDGGAVVADVHKMGLIPKDPSYRPYQRLDITCFVEVEDGWWGTTAAMDAVGAGMMLFPRYAWNPICHSSEHDYVLTPDDMRQCSKCGIRISL
jgi:hypothetical protein